MFEQLSLFDITEHQEALISKDFYKRYVDVNHTSDEEECAYIDYLTFKCWLYVNFPMFEDKEVQTDKWEINKGRKTITTEIGRTYFGTNKQFVSVGFEVKGVSGWSRPCDTLGEVKSALNRALENIERG